MAMYCAKEDGRNRYHIFRPGMDSQNVKRETMETSLQMALDRGEILLYYQPKINTDTGRISAVEALARWFHPELGAIPPTQFIPMAEENGLIGYLGEWVLRTACSQNKAWQDAGYPPMRVAVNFSPKQFQLMDIADMVKRVLDDTLLEPCWLEIEVPEDIMLRGEEIAVQALGRLSRMGVQISIDDFGTGYSTISNFRKIPVNTLNIDRSLTSGICTSLDDEALVRAVVSLAQCLELGVNAEGVETEDQRQMLEALNCSEMQGYFFSRPLPADELERHLDILNKRRKGRRRR